MNKFNFVVVLAIAGIIAILLRYSVTPISAGELPAAFVLDRWTGETFFLAGRMKYHMSWNDALPSSTQQHGMPLLEQEQK